MHGPLEGLVRVAFQVLLELTNLDEYRHLVVLKQSLNELLYIVFVVQLAFIFRMVYGEPAKLYCSWGGLLRLYLVYELLLRKVVFISLVGEGIEVRVGV